MSKITKNTNIIQNFVNGHVWKVYPFDTLSNIIKRDIYNGQNCNFENVFKELEDSGTLMFKEIYLDNLKLICKDNNTELLYNKYLRERVYKAFTGLFGEAILSKLLDSCIFIKVVNMDHTMDTMGKVDFCVENINTGSRKYIQLKSDKYRGCDSSRIVNEKEIHSQLKLDVKYIYYNHDYNNRYFYTDKFIPFTGYGYNQRHEVSKAIFDYLFRQP